MTTVNRLSRRRFLRQLGAMGAVGGLGSAAGALGLLDLSRLAAAAEPPGGYQAMVCIFLFGGNDSYNCVIPSDAAGYDTYALARRGLAVPQAALLPLTDPAHADPLGRSFGLNPAMAALHGVFETERRLAVTLNVGPLLYPLTKAQYRNGSVPHPPGLESHSDQQFQTQSAGILTQDAGYTGWHGRVADVLTGADGALSNFTNISLAGDNALQVGQTVLPYAMDHGGTLDLPLSRHVGSAMQERLRSGVERLLYASPHVLATAYGQIKERALAGNAVLAQALADTTPPTGFPDSDLGRQLQTVAQVMAVAPTLGIGRQTFFCSMGGFDTHSDQNDSQPRLLQTLAEAMAAFYRHTQVAGLAERVTTFTASEFARTFAMNGSQGTDHAWGGIQFVLGGGVQGGLYGTMPDQTLNGPDDVGGQGRFIPTTAIDQVAATLALWFGVSPSDLPYVTPNIGHFAAADLGFMGG